MSKVPIDLILSEAKQLTCTYCGAIPDQPCRFRDGITLESVNPKRPYHASRRQATRAYRQWREETRRPACQQHGNEAVVMVVSLRQLWPLCFSCLKPHAEVIAKAERVIKLIPFSRFVKVAVESLFRSVRLDTDMWEQEA